MHYTVIYIWYALYIILISILYTRDIHHRCIRLYRHLQVHSGDQSPDRPPDRPLHSGLIFWGFTLIQYDLVTSTVFRYELICFDRFGKTCFNMISWRRILWDITHITNRDRLRFCHKMAKSPLVKSAWNTEGDMPRWRASEWQIHSGGRKGRMVLGLCPCTFLDVFNSVQVQLIRGTRVVFYWRQC